MHANRVVLSRGRRTALAVAIAAMVSAPAVFAAPGDPLGPPFAVGQVSFGDAEPIVRRDAVGNFLVVWNDNNTTLNARLFNADGSARGAAFVVSSGRLPGVAMDAAGDFVITWSAISASAYHLYAQRYTAAGSAVGTAIDVNDESPDQTLYSTAVAMDADGDFVVAWNQATQIFLPGGVGPFGSSSIRAKRYAHDGSLLGSDILVDLNLNNPSQLSAVFTPLDPVVAMNPAGDFVVAWNDKSLTSRPAVYVRPYGADGRPLGPKQRVNTLLQRTAYGPVVAMDDDGDFVVVWSVPHQLKGGLIPSASGYDIYTQRYSKTGSPNGQPIEVSQNVSSNPEPGPALAMDPVGDFAIAWLGSPTYCCVPASIRLQSYSASGAALGGNQTVVGDTYQELGIPGLAMDAHGNMVMAWTFENTIEAELLSGR
jgi:hypothetical protein